MRWAYYNEIDPFAAAWLRKLILFGHIAPGDVDTRDIRDVAPDDLAGFAQHHWFAGIGVWSYALRLAGWDDERPVWTGSCPCQPFSQAGRAAGFADERHLWPAFFHLIRERRPDVIFGEQAASQAGLAWLDLVRSDLEGEDYAVGATDLCAAGSGAPHARQRLYFVGRRTWPDTYDVDSNRRRSTVQMGRIGRARHDEEVSDERGNQRASEPRPPAVAHGAPARVGRLRGYGNALDARAAVDFIEAAMSCLP